MTHLPTNLYQIFSFVFFAILLTACKKDDAVESSAPAIVQNDIAAIDSKVGSFMTTYSVPGASIAISKNGKLVYRKGYGLADVAANERVNTNHKFRVASVSKTITAVAIHKLIQDNKLQLDAKVFGTGAVLANDYGAGPYSANVQAITVRQMLLHTAGWRNVWPGDPAFAQPTLSQNQLISWVLANNAVTATPGTQSQYSNFCFIVLARIVEKVSGKTYEQFIQQDVLFPLGATNTQIAGVTEAERKPNEVKYYGQGGEIGFVYTDPWTRMDGAGGVISTPTDLVRMLCAVDSFSTRPDILNTTSLNLMTTPNSVSLYNGCGFYVDNDASLGKQWYHFGSLPGSQALVIRTSKGFNLAFTINSRFTNGNAALNAIATFVSQILGDATISWQDIDQF
jgi:D-alanyl-D-alanine carboxypeptidase